MVNKHEKILNFTRYERSLVFGIAEEMESPISDAIMSPEEELDGCEPDPLGKRPAALPSTPPPAEEEEDELYRQSLEIISQYLREQATGAKDAKPLGGSGTTSRKALETLRRVGDGVQRNHETAFQGWVCGVLPCRGPRRRHQKCAAGFCRCCRSRSWFGISNKIAF
nr:PREDICTED: induced myeloid leukemia cell differentiation protein Mcl-1 homolog [Bos mutus]